MTVLRYTFQNMVQMCPKNGIEKKYTFWKSGGWGEAECKNVILFCEGFHKEPFQRFKIVEHFWGQFF